MNDLKKCSSCGETKPKSEFKRRLTKRQSQTLLRRNKPISQGIVVDSIKCRSCWSLTKRKTPLTIKEIENKRESGDIRGVLADLMIKTKRQDTNALKSRHAKEAWVRRRTKPIEELKRNLQKQVAKYANRYHSSKNYVAKLERQATTQGQMSPQNKLNQQLKEQHASLVQHRQNYEEARAIRDMLLERAKGGTPVDVDVLIDNFFKREV